MSAVVTRQLQRSTPTLKSKIGRGYRPVNRTATNAIAVGTTKATQRIARQITCWITSNHLNSQSHELKRGKSSPSTWTGWACGSASSFEPLRAFDLTSTIGSPDNKSPLSRSRGFRCEKRIVSSRSSSSGFNAWQDTSRHRRRQQTCKQACSRAALASRTGDDGSDLDRHSESRNCVGPEPTYQRIKVIVRVNKPHLLPLLTDFLRLRVDCAVDQISSDQLDVALLGSYRDNAMRLELESRLQRWQAAYPGVQVEVLDETEGNVVSFPNLPNPVAAPSQPPTLHVVEEPGSV